MSLGQEISHNLNAVPKSVDEFQKALFEAVSPIVPHVAEPQRAALVEAMRMAMERLITMLGGEYKNLGVAIIKQSALLTLIIQRLEIVSNILKICAESPEAAESGLITVRAEVSDILSDLSALIVGAA